MLYLLRIYFGVFIFAFFFEITVKTFSLTYFYPYWLDIGESYTNEWITLSIFFKSSEENISGGGICFLKIQALVLLLYLCDSTAYVFF